MARGYIAHEMDLASVVSVVLAFLGGSSLATVVSIFVFRHQARRDSWKDYFEWSGGQIVRALELADEQQANKVKRELAEAYQAARTGTSLDAWRTQQGVEAVATRSIAPADLPMLTAVEVEQMRDLLARSKEVIPSLLSAEDHWLRGNAYYQSGQYQEAVDSYTQALRLRPDFPEAYNNRGAAYLALGEDQKAIEDFNEALRLRPDYPEAYYNRGVAYGNLGEHQRAIADYNEALRLRPDYPEAYYNRGNAYGHLGEHQKAITDFNEALRLRPDYPEAYNNRGVAYGNPGEHQRAIADYNEALRLRPDDPEAYYNRACVYSLQQDIEPCVENLGRAVALDAKHKEQGRSDPDLEWARQDARVRKLLDIP